jgi:hypothetical protein
MAAPLQFGVNELSTGQYTAVIVGNDGVTRLPAVTLSTLTLTLYVIKQDGTQAVVNGRNVQNVLNANNVTVDPNGNLTWAIQVGDTTLVENVPNEIHRAVFAWTWAAGAGNHEVWLTVAQLLRVP